MKYRVSIIIPVYNCKRFLKRAVESILGQKNFCLDELILVDDGSTDGSGLLCDHYSEEYSNIKTLHQMNSGVSVARNNGIKAAEGKWIFFLDSDDYLFDNAINKLMKYSDADLVSGCFVSNCPSECSDTCGFDDGMFEAAGIKSALDDSLINKKTFFNCWARLYKKSIIDKNNIFFPENVKVAEDMVFVYTYIRYCQKIAFLNEPIYFYYINANNTTSVIPKSFDINLYIYHWQKVYFSKNHDYLNKLDYVFSGRVFVSVKTAAYYLPFSESIAYIKSILRNDDFLSCYFNSNICFANSSDKLIDKFIKMKNPYLIYFTVMSSKIKTKIYNLISGDKND